MTLILVVLLVLILLGGIPAYGYRADVGYAPVGVVGLIVTVLLLVILLRLCGFWV